MEESVESCFITIYGMVEIRTLCARHSICKVQSAHSVQRPYTTVDVQYSVELPVVTTRWTRTWSAKATHFTMRTPRCLHVLLLLSLWTTVAALQPTLTKFHNFKYSQSSKLCDVSCQLRLSSLKAPLSTRRRSIPPAVISLHSVASDDESRGQDVSASSSTTSSSSNWKERLHIRNPLLQFVVVMLLYTLHLVVLSSHAIVFPVQLIPNNKGHFSSIGWDSLVGSATLFIYLRYRRSHVQKNQAKGITAFYPWRLPMDNLRFRLTSFLTTVALVQAYFWTGRFSLFWEDTVYSLSGLGFYITQPMKRSLCVLLGHLTWVAVGTALLRWLPRPPKFFGSARNFIPANDSQANNSTQVDHPINPYRWFQCNIQKSSWVWWTIGGYFVSSWLFNMADGINQYVLPQSLLLDQETSVVSQLITPEHNDVVASIIGYIAPCLTAPWWEEVLYRGFALPAATQLLGYPSAVFWQGVVFSAHHMSLTAALPLAVLGWTWAMLYRECNNLWVVMLVHGLWNSRVFLCSWMGF